MAERKNVIFQTTLSGSTDVNGQAIMVSKRINGFLESIDVFCGTNYEFQAGFEGLDVPIMSVRKDQPMRFFPRGEPVGYEDTNRMPLKFGVPIKYAVNGPVEIKISTTAKTDFKIVIRWS